MPEVIERLFRAANADPAVVAECLTPDAVILYDGMLFKGPSSAEVWRAESQRRYPGMAIEPYDIVVAGDDVSLKMRLHGEFGGPRDRTCKFRMRGELIERIEVH